jgi:hypothetical protein
MPETDVKRSGESAADVLLAALKLASSGADEIDPNGDERRRGQRKNGRLGG